MLSIWSCPKFCHLGKGYFFTKRQNFRPIQIEKICRQQINVGVLRGSVVKCMTRNPGVLGSSHTGSSGFFRGSVLGQDTSEPQPSSSETQERHE